MQIKLDLSPDFSEKEKLSVIKALIELKHEYADYKEEYFVQMCFLIRNGILERRKWDFFGITFAHKSLNLLGWDLIFLLEILPYCYESINNHENFDWDFVEQGQDTIIHFIYQNEGYIVTVSDSYHLEADGLTEFIPLTVLKQTIEEFKKTYTDFVRRNLKDIMPMYVLELEQLTFTN